MLVALTIAGFPSWFVAGLVVWQRRHILRRSAAGHVQLIYVALLMIEGLAFAAQAVGLLVCITPNALSAPWLVAGAWGIFCAGASAIVVLDALLFLVCGMRLQKSLLSFADALTEFANDVPWRRYLAVATAGIAAVGVGSAAGFHAMGTRATLSATTGICIGAAGVAFALLAEAIRRKLPMTFTYEWNNRVIGSQSIAIRKLARARPQAPAADLVDARGVPRLFTSASEVSTPVDETFPLMRASTGFVGKKHFSVRIAPEEKPHVVVLFLESFRAADINVLGAVHRPSITPHFDALSEQGILWNNFYSNGTITSRAMTSALYGILPNFRDYSAQGLADPPPFIGLPHIFSDRGYLSAFFCDGPLDWENKRAYFLKHGFPLFYGAPSIKTAYPEAPEHAWSFSDEYLMRFHADWLARQDAAGQPTFSSLLTVSTHWPWAVVGAPDPDVAVPKDSPYYKYLRTIMYTDACLGLYMDLLRASGLDKKTVFLILGDHGQQIDAKNDVTWSGNYTADGMRVPLLLLAPGRVEPKVIKETASQVDILPTVLDIFDIHTTHHAVGTSLVRECDTRQAICMHPWAPGMLANCFGNFRYVYAFDGQKSALYDMARDPKETRNIAALHPDLISVQEQQVGLLHTYLNDLYENHRMAPRTELEYLRFPRLHDAPAHFPRRLEEISARASTLVALGAQSTPASLYELCLYMVALGTSGFSDDERLQFVQLMIMRKNIAQMGEMTDPEIARLLQLEQRLQLPEASFAAVPWLAKASELVRQDARTLPYPGLRASQTAGWWSFRNAWDANFK